MFTSHICLPPAAAGHTAAVGNVQVGRSQPDHRGAKEREKSKASRKERASGMRERETLRSVLAALLAGASWTFGVPERSVRLLQITPELPHKERLDAATSYQASARRRRDKSRS